MTTVSRPLAIPLWRARFAGVPLRPATPAGEDTTSNLRYICNWARQQPLILDGVALIEVKFALLDIVAHMRKVRVAVEQDKERFVKFYA